MISKLRSRHRNVFFVIAVGVPILLFLALTSRAPEPVVDALPTLEGSP